MVQFDDGDKHDQRNIDGVTACGGSRRPLPIAASDGRAGRSCISNRGRCVDRKGFKCGHRISELVFEFIFFGGGTHAAADTDTDTGNADTDTDGNTATAAANADTGADSDQNADTAPDSNAGEWRRLEENHFPFSICHFSFFIEKKSRGF